MKKTIVIALFLLLIVVITVVILFGVYCNKVRPFSLETFAEELEKFSSDEVLGQVKGAADARKKQSLSGWKFTEKK